MGNDKRSRPKTWRERYKQHAWKKNKCNRPDRVKCLDLYNGKPNINVSLITSFLKAIGDKPWYESLQHMASSITNAGNDKNIDHEKMLVSGTEILRKYGKSYSINVSQVDSDERWLHKSAMGGEGVTKGDRLNSLALLLEQNPILNFFCIKKLLDIAQSNVNRDRITALNALHTLFVQRLLPNRKLLFLSQYPHILSYIHNNSFEITDTSEVTPIATQLLLLITFEHHLKLAFAVFVDILGRGISDHLFVIQKTCIDIATDLLTQHPEQEYALLQMLTRNIHNSDMKISSRVSWNLRQVTKVHKGFKKFIIELIGNTLNHILHQMNANLKSATRWRSSKYKNRREKNKGLSHKVQENLISITKLLNFLSEIQNRDDHETLESLLKVYTSFIAVFFSGKAKTIYVKEEASRVIRAMAIGLDKCLDHSSNNLAKSDIKKSIECYMDTLYKITHTNKSKATVITLLGLIYRCTIVFDLAKNRFYRLIYDKLQEIDIFDTSNEKRLYNIVHQMLSQDDNISRISAFLKRILQSSMHESNSSKSLACLIIVQNIIRNNKKLKILFKPGLDDTFDAGKRAPEFSNAESSYLWERHLLNSSYDPAIAANSRKIDGKVRKTKFFDFQVCSI